MGYGFHDFAPNDVFGATDADGILRQTTMWFEDTTSRDIALSGILEEGMRAYTADEDGGTFWWYSEALAQWCVETQPVQSWSPITVTQSGTVTHTVNWANFQKNNGAYRAVCKLTFTGTGSSGNPILVSTPFTHIEGFGNFGFWDDSSGYYRVGIALPHSTTQYSFAIDQGTGLYGMAGSDGITADDILWLQVTGTY